MGVVIQEMANPETAGVMFSRNPVTGNPSEIVITANYGLGEVATKHIGNFVLCNFHIFFFRALCQRRLTLTRSLLTAGTRNH